MPSCEPQTYTGMSGQDIVRASTFWSVLNVSLRNAWSVFRNSSSGIHDPWSVVRDPSPAICYVSSVIRCPSSVIPRLSSIVHRPSSVINHPSTVICCLSSVIRNPSSVMRPPPSGTFSSLTGGSNWLEVMIFCDRQFFGTNREFQLTF